METITLSLTKKQIEQLKTTFSNALTTKIPPYSFYQVKTEDCTITAYTSGKVVFQGQSAATYASSFIKEDQVLEHAGSDEVGTGDYFGPVVVCACVVDRDNIDFLNALHITDSKVLKDSYIESIGESLMNRLSHSLQILQNEKYNKVHQTNNLNAIKAKLHNQAYLHLSKKTTMPNLAVIDQFAPEKLYFNYLKNETSIFRNLHFETKAESKYLAVAAASVIARYVFLKTWQQMEKQWEMSFTKGAGDKVDLDIQSFIKRHGFHNLYHVAKIHFKNTPLDHD